MGNITAYFILIVAVVLGTASNGFAKGSQGFTLLIPSILTTLTIVGCMYALSLVMKSIPVGITYASFAGLCIIATVIVGVLKFNQIPNLYSVVGLLLIITGVLVVNLLGNKWKFYVKKYCKKSFKIIESLLLHKVAFNKYI